MNRGCTTRAVSVVTLGAWGERMANELVVIPADQHAIIRGVKGEVRHEGVQVIRQLDALDRNRNRLARTENLDTAGAGPAPFEASGHFTPVQQAIAPDAAQSYRHALLRKCLITLDRKIRNLAPRARKPYMIR